jgi:hypothetical protein
MVPTAGGMTKRFLSFNVLYGRRVLAIFDSEKYKTIPLAYISVEALTKCIHILVSFLK